MQKKQVGLIWFKNDLRVNDNVSLLKAMENNEQLIALYCFDPRQFEIDCFGFKKTEKFRAKFLIETVTELKQNLASKNITLFVYFNKPEAVIPNLVEDLNIASIYLQKEWTQEEVTVVRNTKSLLPNIAFIESYDQFLFHPKDIPFEIDKIPNMFTNFRKKCEKYSSVKREVSITRLPNVNIVTNNTKIPSLKDLGFDDLRTSTKTAFPFKGGENEALKRLDDYFFVTKKLAYYKQTRNGLVGADYSSKFSAWLANGSISARTIYWNIKAFEKEHTKNQSTYWLVFELIWRDYFKHISLKHDNSIFKIEGILKKRYDWKIDNTLVQNWINGETKEPFVNANMIELKETGWMSNRGRQNVASYFAKELLLDWRIGAAYFESLLIDYDVHSNYGNWMYVAGVGNDPRDRKFNVKLQAERYDANKKFQNLWLQQTLF